MKVDCLATGLLVLLVVAMAIAGVAVFGSLAYAVVVETIGSCS